MSNVVASTLTARISATAPCKPTRFRYQGTCSRARRRVTGAQRGRNFERLFYELCRSRGVQLCERAGARTLAEEQSASGLLHEVDAASRSVACITHWELKHMTTEVPKNELLIFNGKGLDFLQESGPMAARTPMFRFLLSGAGVRDECRYFAMLWGIMIVEPVRMPLPLLYEAVASGAAAQLTPAESEAVRDHVYWACRPLQRVLAELNDWTSGKEGLTRADVESLGLRVRSQIGNLVVDCLDEQDEDWLDNAAEDTWNAVGGW